MFPIFHTPAQEKRWKHLLSIYSPLHFCSAELAQCNNKVIDTDNDGTRTLFEMPLGWSILMRMSGNNTMVFNIQVG